MPEPDAVPLPREGEVFFDVRGEARTMRLSWYADSAVAVFSIWQGNRCTGTFRLPFADLARMVGTLQSGPPSRPAKADPYDHGEPYRHREPYPHHDPYPHQDPYQHNEPYGYHEPYPHHDPYPHGDPGYGQPAYPPDLGDASSYHPADPPQGDYRPGYAPYHAQYEQDETVRGRFGPGARHRGAGQGQGADPAGYLYPGQYQDPGSDQDRSGYPDLPDYRQSPGYGDDSAGLDGSHFDSQARYPADVGHQPGRSWPDANEYGDGRFADGRPARSGYGHNEAVPLPYGHAAPAHTADADASAMPAHATPALSAPSGEWLAAPTASPPAWHGDGTGTEPDANAQGLPPEPHQSWYPATDWEAVAASYRTR